jgi:hypothetical protein
VSSQRAQRSSILACNNVYKPLLTFTNLYRMRQAPVLKSNHCAGDQSDRLNWEQKIDLSAQRGASMNREKSSFTFATAILAAATASAMLAVGTQSASAQAVIVTTPFAFSAGNEFYPVGTYEFGMVSEFSLSIRNVNGGGEKFFNVRPEEERPRGSRAGVVLSNSEGHKNLQAVYFPGIDRSEVLVHERSSELQIPRLPRIL